MPEKIPISGGPHAGKTTLMGDLRERFPDAHFVPEPAELVIASELLQFEADSGYAMRVPWLDYINFASLAIAKSERLERDIPAYKKLAFQDRSLIDNIAYARINDGEQIIPGVREKIALAKYSFAMICEPVGEHTLTDIRRESADEAIAIHQALVTAYEESGLDVISIPAISREARVDLVARILDERGIDVSF
jgi:predicted ATPase